MDATLTDFVDAQVHRLADNKGGWPRDQLAEVWRSLVPGDPHAVNDDY